MADYMLLKAGAGPAARLLICIEYIKAGEFVTTVCSHSLQINI